MSLFRQAQAEVERAERLFSQDGSVDSGILVARLNATAKQDQQLSALASFCPKGTWR